MKKSLKYAILMTISVLLIISSASLAYAGSTAIQVVTVAVLPISEISVNGDPSGRFALTIDRSAKEQEGSFTYSITTNETNKKITGFINSDMPPSSVLKVLLEAPESAKSLGFVNLSSKPSDLVTGISRLKGKDKMVKYSYINDNVSDSPGLIQKTITLTIADGS